MYTYIAQWYTVYDVQKKLYCTVLYTTWWLVVTVKSEIKIEFHSLSKTSIHAVLYRTFTKLYTGTVRGRIGTDTVRCWYSMLVQFVALYQAFEVLLTQWRESIGTIHCTSVHRIAKEFFFPSQNSVSVTDDHQSLLIWILGKFLRTYSKLKLKLQWIKTLSQYIK